MSKPCQHGISQPCGCKVTKAVALVLVPGIMGSRLKNRESGKTVWDPAAGKDSYSSGTLRALHEAQQPVLDKAVRKGTQVLFSEGF
ncbi:hypothetical protein [Pelagibaculum spongiae]|nr:hypothetical protein [Pelagibaculum spongiae]